MTHILISLALDAIATITFLAVAAAMAGGKADEAVEGEEQ